MVKFTSFIISVLVVVIFFMIYCLQIEKKCTSQNDEYIEGIKGDDRMVSNVRLVTD